MSLINQVLRDLEQRQDCPAAAANGVLQGLDVPAEAPRPPVRRRTRMAYVAVFLLGACGLLLLALAFLGKVPMFAFGEQPISSAPAVDESRQVSVARTIPASPKLTSASAASVPEPVVEVSPSVPSTTPSPKPAKLNASRTQPTNVVATPPANTAATQAKQTPARAAKTAVSPTVTPTATPAVTPTPAAVAKSRTPSVAHKRKVASPAATIQTPPKKATRVATADEADVSASGAVAKQRRQLTARQQASVAFKTGHSLMMKRRYADAEVALRQALSLDPRHLKARELLAGSYLRRGDLAGAARLMQDGLSVAPTHAVFTKLYARILAEQNALPSAIQVLTRNAPPVADDLEYHALLAALYQRQGQHKQAARTYSELVKLRRKAGMWWIGLGVSLEALGNKAEAALAYKNARDSDSLSGKLLAYVDGRLSALGRQVKPVD